MSKTYSEIYKETIDKVRAYCERKIGQFDEFSESGIATQTDYAMAYAYRKVLQIINESED